MRIFVPDFGAHLLFLGMMSEKDSGENPEQTPLL